MLYGYGVKSTSLNAAIIAQYHGSAFSLDAYAVGGVLPSLVLDSENGFQTTPIGLTRASAGTYIDTTGAIQTAAADVARYDYSTGRRALLLEGTATNIIWHAIASTSGWVAGGGVKTDLALAALGIFPGLRVASAGLAGDRAISFCGGWVAGQPHQLTAYYMAGTSNRAMIVLANITAGGDTSLVGPVGALAPNLTAAGPLTNVVNTEIGGGIYRVSATFVPAASATSTRFGIGPHSATVGENIIALGAQIEAGSAPSSLILSAGAPTTRAADVAQITNLAAGSYDLRRIDSTGTVDTTGIVHPGGAVGIASGLVHSVTYYPGGTL